MIFRHIFLTCMVAMICSCAAKHANTLETPLTKLEQYFKSKGNESLYLLRNFWSKEYAAEGLTILADTSKNNEVNRDTINYLIRFTDLISSISYRNQLVNANKACVLIIGETKNQETVFMNIPYILEYEVWLISGEILINYPGESDTLPTQPDCESKI